jgi:hypothetical protein
VLFKLFAECWGSVLCLVIDGSLEGSPRMMDGLNSLTRHKKKEGMSRTARDIFCPRRLTPPLLWRLQTSCATEPTNSTALNRVYR